MKTGFAVHWQRIVIVLLVLLVVFLILEEGHYLELTTLANKVAEKEHMRSTNNDPIEDYGEETVNNEAEEIIRASKSDASSLKDEAVIIPEPEQSDLDLYLRPDTSVIDPAFRNTRRIIVDADFHFYRDRYGLINPNFNHSELESVLHDVTRTWMKANIWVRFKKLPQQGELLRDEAADAVRWWVFGYKNKEADPKRYWKDIDLFLVKGVSSMTREYAMKEVIRRFNEYNGHSLMNWVLNLGPNRQGRTIKIDIYTVGVWPWYNGGAKRGRIFVRSGSCHRDVKASAGIAADDNLHRVCNSWSTQHDNETEMTTMEMSRILAHEFGHLFGLAHPDKGACQYAKKIEQLVLMAQQRSVALEGTECSETNPVAKYSRHIPRNEMNRARTVAAYISQEQRKRAAAAAAAKQQN